jgi:hypothetical protein
LLDFLKHPQLVKGSSVGYDILELKKTSTSELKNILNIIFLYFTKKTRQKTQNSNFKNLYIRIKRELQLREKDENLTKIKFQVEEFKRKIIVKQTQIEEIIIPDFFNDKKQIQISNNINSNNVINCNSSPSLSTVSCEENVKEDIDSIIKDKNDLEMFYNKNPVFQIEDYEDINYLFSWKSSDFI